MDLGVIALSTAVSKLSKEHSVSTQLDPSYLVEKYSVSIN